MATILYKAGYLYDSVTGLILNWQGAPMVGIEINNILRNGDILQSTGQLQSGCFSHIPVMKSI